MKIKINFQLVGAIFSIAAMTMTSAVYASCAMGSGTNVTQMTVEVCGTVTPCRIWNDRVHLLVSDDCWTWCCPDGQGYYNASCEFHNETFLGVDRCCESTDAGLVVSTKACDAIGQ